MGGFFGVVSKQDCASDLFYGTDYHSHLGTRRGGMAVRNVDGFNRSIHTIEILFDVGAREVHMRPACPTLLYPCEFLNFSTSRSTLDLAGRKAISAMENSEPADIGAYATADSAENRRMVDAIRRQLKLTSLKYQKLENLVNAIGLPKERLCTHCWDGSSYF